MCGDELESEGVLQTLAVFDDSSGWDHLARQGIYGLLGWPTIRLLSRRGGSPIYRMLLRFKARTQATIARIPEAAKGCLRERLPRPGHVGKLPACPVLQALGHRAQRFPPIGCVRRQALEGHTAARRGTGGSVPLDRGRENML